MFILVCVGFLGMSGISLDRLRYYCDQTANHVCSSERVKCEEIREELRVLLSSVSPSSAQYTDSCSSLECLIRDFSNKLHPVLKSKLASVECSPYLRCFLCWMIAVLNRQRSVATDSRLQHADIVIISARKSIACESGKRLLCFFEDILSSFRASLRSFCSIEEIGLPLLKLSLFLAEVNLKMGRNDTAASLLADVETSSSVARDAIEDVVAAYRTLIDAMATDPTLMLSDFVIDRCYSFIEKAQFALPQHRVSIMKSLAIAIAKKGDYEKGLHIINSAECIEPTPELLLARCHILVTSLIKDKQRFADELSQALHKLLCSSSFSIKIGVSLVQQLSKQGTHNEAEKFLSLIWHSIGKSVPINDDALDFFVYRLRRCLRNNDVLEVKKMFLFFDEYPSVLLEMPSEIAQSICFSLNKYAVLFVKDAKFECALEYYEICDNLLRGLPNLSGPPNGKTGKQWPLPSLAQIKRSLALCQFQVGHFDEFEKVLFFTEKVLLRIRFLYLNFRQ